MDLFSWDPFYFCHMHYSFPDRTPPQDTAVIQNGAYPPETSMKPA